MLSNFNPEWILRILCAVLVGSLIGYERYSQSKEAGVRTHAVVALASCLMMIISQNAFPEADKYDAARIASQVVSGMGFLGAGMIFVKQGSIQGLSTAAGMWATCAIGLAIGAGMYIIGLFSSVVVYFIQKSLPRFFPFVSPRSILKLMIVVNPNSNLEKLNNKLVEIGYSHSENMINSNENGEIVVKTEISTHKNISINSVLEEIKKCDDVIDVKII